MMRRKLIVVAIALLLTLQTGYLYAQTQDITRQEMLRGSITPEREVDGFAMPIRARINGKEVSLTPSATIQSFEFSEEIKTFEVDRNFYVDAEKSAL